MKNTLTFLYFLIVTLTGKAQLTSMGVQQFVTAENNLNKIGLQYPSLVLAFYENCKYEPAWIGEGKSSQCTIFFNDLDRASDLGLDSRDYQFKFLQSFRLIAKLNNNTDSIIADLRITDAAIHFYGEVKKGNVAPLLKYNGLKYHAGLNELPGVLAKYISNNQLNRLAFDLEPTSKEYNNMKGLLIHFNYIMENRDFQEVNIKSRKVDSTNTELIIKLYQLGIFDTLPARITNKQLVQKLQSAQKLFNLLNDGVLRSTTIGALNVPLGKRRKELSLALNYLRWLNEIKLTDKVIFLNIPATMLFAYDHGQMILESRVIVGKPSTPTPTLASTITEVILYPYWNVPNKIATKELLPGIKRNIGYLEQNNFQVLNKQGKIMDPYKIDWASLSAGYFPYLIRQSTGCDNSLGIVKLNFYNPFTVYLHDTPGKGLFFLNKRYFSHGCMRVEKAIELAKLIAREHAFTIQHMEDKGCAPDQPPIVLTADTSMKLIVLYSTVWYDSKGTIGFFDDVYNRN